MSLTISPLILSKPNIIDSGGASAPINTVAPTFSTPLVVGTAATITAGTWSNSPTSYNYKVYRGATLVDEQTTAATSINYTPVQADAGNTSNMKCVVTATNGAGSASADSNTVARVMDANAETYIINSGNTSFRNAVNQLAIDLKAVGAFGTKWVRVYPFLGGTAAACAVDLVTGTSGTFGGTFTFSANGPLPNGTNAFFNTALNSNTLTANNSHFGFDSFTNNAPSIDYDMGVSTNSTAGTDNYGLFLRRSNGTCGFDAGTFSNGRVSSTTTDSAAFFVGSIVASNDRRLFRNATQLNISTTSFSQTMPNGNIFIFAMNNIAGGGATLFGAKGSKLVTIGSGLTSAEVSTLQTIRNTFQTAVGR